jgi:hypothetical protein
VSYYPRRRDRWRTVPGRFRDGDGERIGGGWCGDQGGEGIGGEERNGGGERIGGGEKIGGGGRIGGGERVGGSERIGGRQFRGGGGDAIGVERHRGGGGDKWFGVKVSLDHIRGWEGRRGRRGRWWCGRRGLRRRRRGGGSRVPKRKKARLLFPARAEKSRRADLGRLEVVGGVVVVFVVVVA